MGKKKHCKWGGGSFNAFPRAMLRSKEYSSLSPYAVKLLNDLAAQYTGNNNGDLCAAFSVLKERGWRSSGTLNKAIKEVKEKGFVQVSRQGGRNRATLYALAFYWVDMCIDRKTGKSKLEIPDTMRPSNAWMRHEN